MELVSPSSLEVIAVSKRVSASGVVSCCFSICAMLWAHDTSAAEKDAVTHKDVAKAMTQAKELADKKQWNAALAALRRAEQAPEKTSYAEYKIDEFKGYVLTQQRKYEEAADIFARIAQSKEASSQERLAHMKTAAHLYLQTRQYQNAARAAASALKTSPGDPALLEIAGQARYLAGDFKAAADTMEQLVKSTQSQGRKPAEGWLQILLNSYYKLDDRQRVTDAWQALLRHYPQPKYWENVLRLKTAASHPEPVELAYLRLIFDLGLLNDPQDYEDLALSAIDSGAPGEAVRMLQWGFEHKIFPASEQERFKRLFAHAQAKSAENQARLAQLAEAAKRATTGQPSVELGRAYLGSGQYDDATAALERGLKKGQVINADQARVELGIAYLKNEQPEQARETFAAVEAGSEWHDLAELWTLRASNQN
jgi:uncharacterized protein HemY